MTDPGSARPFSPAELSAIEDALEQLASDDAFVLGPLGSAEADAAVRERLASYRAITRLTRDALAAHEAPAHVLDRVRALARESAHAVPSTTDAEAPARKSFWSRIRAAWTIPMLATAAAAVLVVVIVVPTREAANVAQAPAAPAPSSSTTPSSAPVIDGLVEKRADERLAMATEQRQEEGEVRGGAALAPAETAKDASRMEPSRDDELRRSRGAKDEPAKERAESKPKADAKPKPSIDPQAPTPKAPPAPATKPTDTPSSGGAGDGKGPGGGLDEHDDRKANLDALARADAARRSGDCAAAVKIYDSLRTHADRKTRARAKAGLALCAERAGDAARASDLLTQARKDDAAIDQWVEAER